MTDLTAANTRLAVWGLLAITRDALMTTPFEVRTWNGITDRTPAWLEAAAANLRNEWRARVKAYPGAFVVYDPDGDADDWMLVGDDLDAIVAESVTHHEEINDIDATPPPIKPTFTFNGCDAMTDEDMADALEQMASMVREGYTSGDAQGAGWWTVTGLTDADDMPRDEEDGDDD